MALLTPRRIYKATICIPTRFSNLCTSYDVEFNFKVLGVITGGFLIHY